MLANTSATDCASPLSERRGLEAAITGYPSFSRILTTPFQLLESAKAPCTNTTVGLIGAANAAVELIIVAASASPANNGFIECSCV
ncbi:hypothetical protein D3C76_1693350 [compost metagenome]